jgi:2-phosphoglycerate kinase
MIYLIGGAPRCGKTILAQKLSKKLEIPWMATDTLEAIAMSYTSKKDFSKRFRKSVMRKTAKYSNDLMYGKYTLDQITSAYIKQSEAVWRGIEMLVESELKEGRSFILEGYHIQPKFVADLLKKYGRLNVKSVFLIKSDSNNVLSNSLKYSYKNDWFVKRAKNYDTYKKIAAMIVQLGGLIRREATKFKLKVFVLDTNFKFKLNSVLRYLE